MKFRKTMLIGALVACAAVPAFAQDAGSMKNDAPAKSAWRPDANGARDTAAGFAISTAMVVNDVATRCAALDANLAASASAARDGWWARNQLMVEAANGYVRYLQALYQVKRGEDAAKSFYAGVFQDLRAQGDATVEGLFKDVKDEHATCERLVAAYTSGSMDLAATADQYQVLVAMDRDLKAYRGVQ